METEKLVQQLTAGFETLQEEYQKLHGQYGSLERKLATAREQYNELAKLCDSGALATPPISLSSSPRAPNAEPDEPAQAIEILEERQSTPDAARKVRAAISAAQTLRQRLPSPSRPQNEGVRIWSGPAADRPEPAVSGMMPSISESPLEQDFTIEGKPSRLGCPFAGMAGKKLSSHAASVLSRYNTRDTKDSVSTPLSSVSRVNGRESAAASRKGSRRASFVDPIKAEICGLSDHHQPTHDGEDHESPMSERAASHTHNQHKQELERQAEEQAAEVGVCPIRFLDQHSPEEVATYFEKHKHELPRSHEVCVRRYQSNEQQIRELDEKYGNLVSMIQGLGKKHKDYLPDDPAEHEGEDGEDVMQDAKSAEKVRRWASSVSAQAADAEAVDDVEEERQPHFDRPLREIRLGESPSRPWGLQVPAKYLEDTRSDTSSRPAVITSPQPTPSKEVEQKALKPEVATAAPARCPFGFDKQQPPPPGAALPEAQVPPDEPAQRPQRPPAADRQETVRPQPKGHRQEQPTFIAAEHAIAEPKAAVDGGDGRREDAGPRMVFTGPVFIGYSAEDAVRILRESGLGGR